MAVLTGTSGELRYAGIRIGKCRSFSIDISRDALETTTLGSKDRTYIEGLRGATGSAAILYDEDDAATISMLNSIFRDDGDTAVSMVLNTNTNKAISFKAFVTQIGTPVSIGEVTACNISFQVSGSFDGMF